MESASTKVLQDYTIRDFLKLLNNATFKYEGEVKKEGYSKHDIYYDIMFNIEDFSKYTSSDYNSFISKLELILRDTFYKYEKLFMVTCLISEVESSKNKLSINTDGFYTHEHFRFVNEKEEQIKTSINIELEYLQEYYNQLNFYLEKTMSFLINLKDVTVKTNQNEFPLPVSMVSKANESTKKKPLEYFEYIFCKIGFLKFKQSFIPSDFEQLNFNESYDDKNEIISYFSFDENNKYKLDSSVSISKLVSDRLTIEYFKSRNLIDENIYNLVEESEIRLFLKLTIARLEYIHKSINEKKENKELVNYPEISNEILLIVKYIIEKYKSFVEKNAVSVDFSKAIERAYPEQKSEETEENVSIKEIDQEDKISSVLSVPQLSYLFFVLKKAQLITPEHDSILFRAIRAIFKTRQSDKISTSKLRKFFDTPEHSAIVFWKDKFKDFSDPKKYI